MSYSPPPIGADAIRRPPAHVLRWWSRLILAASGAVLVGLLATAACLTPDARGYGTHQQLGLYPCTIHVLYGIRCPSCGMTTSWAHLMHGHVLASLSANVGGAMLAVASAVCGPWMLASGLCGRWLWGPPRESVTLAVGLVIVATTLIDWSFRLFLGG